ncbi:amidohydrolase [Bradyrhizobium sp. Cp5.3]|uniref:amidohydrolase n=1 Tax=Bradyrhizobium sp. Cp5.3 TaxID=443598 RepID=UPI001FD9F4CC|nr:amidohydrolase [Bradyrhizobium sp. Cp5.3]
MRCDVSERGALSKTQLVADRRELHRLAEPGWCEVFTASKVVKVLQESGWQVRCGADVISRDARMGLPPQHTLDFFLNRALDHGADPATAEKLRDGFTGVVGTLNGRVAGPVIAFRFDLDANNGGEATSRDHRPVRDGFSSIHEGFHHNCGHDGHTSMGLGLARALAGIRHELAGEIRLIFQPAEEGLRGAKAMVAAGVLDGVDYFVGCHLGVQALSVGEVITGYKDILGSVKLDINFTGKSAHAAISPHDGRNAVLAACVAAQNLMAIPRHGDGDTRVNVGRISGGDSRNTVPSSADLSIELRADNADTLQFLRDTAARVVAGAALMHEVTSRSDLVGESRAASSDPELAKIVHEAAREVPRVKKIRDGVEFRGSDDAAEMMRAVQGRGGKAVYFGIGTELSAIHHNPHFDFNEDALPIGLEILERVACLLGAHGSEVRPRS